MDKISITKSTINRPFGFFEYLYSSNVYSLYLNKFINSVDPDDGSEKYDEKERIITWCYYEPELNEFVYKSRSFEKELTTMLSTEFLFSKTLFDEKLAIYAAIEEVNRFLRTQEMKVDKIEYFINNNDLFKDYNLHNKLVVGLRNIIKDNKNTLFETSSNIETPILITKPPKLLRGNKSANNTAKSFEYINLLSGSENITYLLKDLKKLELISLETELKHFRNVFSGKDIINKIEWTGNISQLNYFIKYLHNKSMKIKDTKKKQWFIAINCFVMSNGSVLKNRRLSAQKIPANYLEIENAINNL